MQPNVSQNKPNLDEPTGSEGHKNRIDKIFEQIHHSAHHKLENENPFNDELDKILERTLARTDARLKEKKILPENYGYANLTKHCYPE